MEIINIAFVIDNNYFKHMCVTIESIIRNNVKNNLLHFYVISDNLGYKNQKLLKEFYSLKENVDIFFIPITNDNLNNMKIKTHVSKAAFAKIYMPDLIKVDKIIYLDCDLVVNDDISILWKEFSDKDNRNFIYAVWNPFYNYDNIYLQIDDDKKTFNSGVMLMRLDLMRKHNSSKRLYGFLQEFNDRTKLHDQAAFNAIFKDNWRELNLRWNVQGCIFTSNRKYLNLTSKEYWELYMHPSIIHYTTNSKPWHFRNCHPHKKLYLKYYRSIFNNFRYEDVNIISLLKKIKESIRYKFFYLVNRIGE